MFRLIGTLLVMAMTAGGYLYFDYRMAARWASAEDSQGLTFGEYLGGLTGRVAGLTGTAQAAGLPTELAGMLPKPPEGWTVRPTEPADVEGFLPSNTRKADKNALAYVKAIAGDEKGKGVEVAALTYERGERKVVIRAVRYPNIIFTSFVAMQQRFELQMRTAQFRGTEFMTVRGLDVSEDLLPEGFRGRYFLADVGAQIHLRVLAPKRMSDKELVPFFETLHVKAMNASVIEKQDGLGEVPVIVLASALDKAARADYVARLAESEAEEASASAAALTEAEARAATEAATQDSGGGWLGGLWGGGDAAPEAEAAAGPAATEINCKTGKDGVKRCAVSGGGQD